MDGRSYALRALRIDEIGAFGQALVQWGRHDPLATGLQAGDYGWLCRNDADCLTQSFLVCADEAGEIVAGGYREGSEGLWLQVDPAHYFDGEVARAIADGVRAFELREVSGPAAPSAVRIALARRGGVVDPEPWPHLWRPISDDDLVDVPNVFPTHTEALVAERIAVQRSAFSNSTFTKERWARMVTGPLFRPELDLVALDEAGDGVSALTAWLPDDLTCGVIEPMGTHRDHWRQGHGSRVLRASFAALRRLGATSVRVGVERTNVAAIAAYQSVGFRVIGYDTTVRLP